jgi:hypothetical protein
MRLIIAQSNLAKFSGYKPLKSNKDVVIYHRLDKSSLLIEG